MEIGKTLYVIDRKDWRDWLENNFETADEIWLVYPNKASGEERIPYNDAVEEALCFGWIDSIVKSIDEHHAAQRFTPRRPKSGYSQPNKERLKWLAEKDLLHPSIKESVQYILEEEFDFPKDITDAIKANPEAWRNYQAFAPAYKRIRVAYIDAARKRPEEYDKRLANFIKATEQNKHIGFGGIDKYFNRS
jgi:uncharacterized protein YdeI (YjbR/CyaY-like superfamily)